MRKILFITLAAAAAFAIASGCSRKEPVKPVTGRVVFVSGEAAIVKSGASMPIKLGDIVEEKDTVVTGVKGIAVIQIFDWNVIRIASNSSCEISKAVKDADVELKLAKGALSSKVLRLDKNKGFKVETPHVVASVRGTEFSVSADAKKDKISVLNGKIEALGTAGSQEKPAYVENGKSADISASGAQTLSVRPIREYEKIDIQKVADVRIVDNLFELKPDDLEKLSGEIGDIEASYDKININFFKETGGKWERVSGE